MKPLRILVYMIGALGASWLTGFLYFVHNLTYSDAQARAKADGIVVLTGGPGRIAAALHLLDECQGTRLLISGVNPETTRAELVHGFGKPDLFACCIDIGYRASDTEGNAAEAARWAAEHRFHSLIVVTSTDHMPRGLAEMRRAMPNALLIPYPIAPAARRPTDWWHEGMVVRVLANEYSKYLFSLARMHLGVSARDI